MTPDPTYVHEYSGLALILLSSLFALGGGEEVRNTHTISRACASVLAGVLGAVTSLKALGRA